MLRGKYSLMPHVSFTGTRMGMTTPQRDWIANFISGLEDTVIGHHGDCKGSDEQFDGIIQGLHGHVVVHPPVNQTYRAYCSGKHILETREIKEYIKRNHEIVMASSTLLATPFTMTEQVRSGTWATIRFARKHRKTVYVIYPNGSVSK